MRLPPSLWYILIFKDPFEQFCHCIHHRLTSLNKELIRNGIWATCLLFQHFNNFLHPHWLRNPNLSSLVLLVASLLVGWFTLLFFSFLYRSAQKAPIAATLICSYRTFFINITLAQYSLKKSKYFHETKQIFYSYVRLGAFRKSAISAHKCQNGSHFEFVQISTF